MDTFAVKMKLMMSRNIKALISFAVVMFFTASFAFAETGEATQEVAGHGGTAVTFLWIAVILMLAKISGLIERVKQPAILGELIMGIILGNLIIFGVDIFESVKHNEIIGFLAEFGIIILLFQVGLESNIQEMKKVGGKSLMVALIGVVVPFVLGVYLVGPWLLPDASNNAHLFLGAALTATSVGITARVMKDLGKLHIPEAKIILGAAVIDDILGLIILAGISAIVTIGAITLGIISVIVLKAVLFLGISIFAGQIFADKLGNLFSKISSGTGMKFALALSFGLVLAYVAELIGLEPIVGAFAAGLVLDPVHFRYFKNPKIVEDVEDSVETLGEGAIKTRIARVLDAHSKKHIEDIIEPLGLLFIPIFFVVTGMGVDLTAFFDPKILVLSLGITLVAFIGKIVAGLAAGSANKWIVGIGMVPRGEVGLTFAAIGRGLGVINTELFSVIVIMVIITTLFTPPVLAYLLKRQDASKQNPAPIAV